MPSNIPFWDDDYQTYDAITLGGVQLFKRIEDGLASVDVKVGQKFDLKHAPGAHGANITFQGYKPADVSIELTIWTREGWNQWQEALTVLRPNPSKGAPTPLDIAHPFTALHNVKSVYVTDIGSPKPSGKQIFKVSITCVEYFPPPTAPAVKTMKGSIGGNDLFPAGPGATRDDPARPIVGPSRGKIDP